MIIAFDAGAFQQSIGGGIFNVAAGFLNAAAARNFGVEFIFVADPVFGEPRSELMNVLHFKPHILYRPVLPEEVPAHITTNDPRVQFIIDGAVIDPLITPTYPHGFWAYYQGRVPKETMIVRSRTARPIDVMNLPDSRALGIAIDRITVTSERGLQEIGFRNPALERGFHHVESDHRWTNGFAELPMSIFDGIDVASIGVHVNMNLKYQLLEGRFDRQYASSLRGAAAVRQKLRLQSVGLELKRLGAAFYFANHFLPVIIPGLKLVTWAHDIIPVLYPNFFASDALNNFVNVINVFGKADHIFCNSNTTRLDIINNLGICPSRLTATGIGGNEGVSRRPSGDVEAVCDKYRLSKDYILSVGTLEPRKNHVRLVRAYDEFRRRATFSGNLVIVGSHGWQYGELLNVISELGMHDTVRVLNGVDNNDLSALYSGALMLAYPSVYEGFGMPVLEAMQCGVPVLTSEGTSMAEISDGCAVLVDPLSIESIALGLAKLYENSALRERLVDAAMSKAGRYKWDRITSDILSVLEEIKR
jgi:glycosyltransferase involved in cell wall biosynthesis